MSTISKCEERRRQRMREVFEALCRLRDRMTELSALTSLAGRAGGVWSGYRLHEELGRVWLLRQQMLDDAPEGVLGPNAETEIPF